MREELTEFKSNIISWYPISKNSKVLQIGKDKEILNELKLKTDNVVVADNLENIEIKNTFDYITLIGTFDNIIETDEILNILTTAQKMLDKNGKILIAMQNKFGMKYWAGQKSEIKSSPLEPILNSKFISIAKIKNILEKLKFKYKFYYPLPDYKYTNVIFTDEYLPTREAINSRDLTFCRDDELLLFSEREAFKQLAEECKDMFPIFANSFFIEISEKDKFEDIRYVSYGITRKAKYRIKTVMEKKFVYKYPASQVAKEHISDISRNIDVLKKLKINCLDTYEDGRIISKYLENAKSFDQVLLEDYNANGLDSTIKKMKEFRKNVLDKLLENKTTDNFTAFEKFNISIPEELKNKLNFTQNGIIDLIFQNCFLKDKELYTYDQEWFEPNVPIEFILYRAVLYFIELKENVDVLDIYKALEIDEFIEYFDLLEEKIQNEILDDKIYNLHKNSVKYFNGTYNLLENYENKIEALKTHEAQLEDVIEKYKNSIEELTNSIKEKDVNLENYANELRAIANSLSWKITKPIRKISGVLRKKK